MHHLWQLPWDIMHLLCLHFKPGNMLNYFRWCGNISGITRWFVYDCYWNAEACDLTKPFSEVWDCSLINSTQYCILKLLVSIYLMFLNVFFLLFTFFDVRFTVICNNVTLTFNSGICFVGDNGFAYTVLTQYLKLAVECVTIDQVIPSHSYMHIQTCLRIFLRTVLFLRTVQDFFFVFQFIIYAHGVWCTTNNKKNKLKQNSVVSLFKQ